MELTFITDDGTEYSGQGHINIDRSPESRLRTWYGAALLDSASAAAALAEAEITIRSEVGESGTAIIDGYEESGHVEFRGTGPLRSTT